MTKSSFERHVPDRINLRSTSQYMYIYNIYSYMRSKTPFLQSETQFCIKSRSTLPPIQCGNFSLLFDCMCINLLFYVAVFRFIISLLWWFHSQKRYIIVEQISWAIFQGGGLWSTTFVSIYQNVRIGL